MCVGIIDNCVVGPYLLPDCLNGPAYCVPAGSATSAV
jgi:hypothetical protein